MKKLAIIGAAELGALVKYYASESGKYEVTGFYDDFKTGFFDTLPIIGKTEQISEDFANKKIDELFIAIGYNYMPQRKHFFKMFHGTIPFATIIHPSSFIDPSTKVGQGTIIFPGCTVDQHSAIGNNVLLNTGVCVAHHSSVGDHCFLAPRVAVAGRVEIKEGCFIGIGTIVRDLITVESNCTIGAGSLVLRNTEANTVLYGAPAKVVQKK